MGIVMPVGFPIVLLYTVSLNCMNSKMYIFLLVYFVSYIFAIFVFVSDTFAVNEVPFDMLLYIVTTFPRSGHGSRSLTELLGQWGE